MGVNIGWVTRGRGLVTAVGILMMLAVLTVCAAAQQSPTKQGTSDEDLVKQTQNPVADLISVP
jgi:hypothetical protein